MDGTARAGEAGRRLRQLLLWVGADPALAGDPALDGVALAQAVAGVIDAQSLPPGGLSPPERRRFAALAAGRLLAQGLPREALALAEAAGDDPVGLRLRLDARERLHDMPGLAVELARLHAAPPAGPAGRAALAHLLRRPGTVRLHPDTRAALRLAWGPAAGPDGGSLARRLRGLDALDPPMALPPAEVDAVAAMRGDAGPAREALARGMRWSRAATLFLSTLSQLAAQTPGRRPAEVPALLAELEGLLDLAGAEPLRRMLGSGRSVVLAVTHGGFARVGIPALRRMGRPVALVSSFPPGSTPFEHHLTTGAPDFPQRLATLARAARREPWVILVAADGRWGDAPAHDLLGRRVRVGRGTARLARAAGAATAFFHAAWTGDGFRLDVTPGPDARDRAEGLEEAFDRFYLARLGEVIRGPAENLGLLGTLVER